MYNKGGILLKEKNNEFKEFDDTASIARDAVKNLAQDDKNKKPASDMKPVDVEEADYTEYIESIRPKTRKKRDFTDSPAYKSNKTFSSSDDDSDRDMFMTTSLEELGSFDEFEKEARKEMYALDRKRIAFIGVSLIILLIFTFLIIKINKTSSKLEEAELKLENNQKIVDLANEKEHDFEMLQEENESLKEENRKLKAENRKNITLSNNDETDENDDETDETTPETPTASGKTHTVQAGDNFWTIAIKYYNDGTKGDEIMQFNGYVDPASLQIGDVLNLP